MPELPKPTKGRVLIVEDEAVIAEFVATELRFEGYEVRIERDGMRAMIAARQDEPDLVLLDRMLPGLDGLEVCRRLRTTSDVPIIMLTAKGDTRDRIEGLNAGATDYLPKPFDVEELLARVAAQLRMRRPPPKSRFQVADLSLDLESREVYRGDRAIALTPKEFDLLGFLIRHPRQVKTREQILEAVWGYDFVGDDNVLEVYVRYVRNKVEREGLPKLIHTVRGVGYVLKEGEPA
jgi:two-component system OmpR family response regulator